MHFRHLICALLGATMLVPPATAQLNIPADVTHTYPFGACDYAIGAGNTVYMGSGGGVFVLDASTDTDPKLHISAGENLIRVSVECSPSVRSGRSGVEYGRQRCT
jgi:hypothetical protein